MIFSKENIQKIARDEKTESRRRKKPRVKVGRVYRMRTHFHDTQHRGSIRILKIYKERLGAISDVSVRREGCKSREEFFRMLYCIHGKHIHRNTHVYVIRFRYEG